MPYRFQVCHFQNIFPQRTIVIIAWSLKLLDISDGEVGIGMVIRLVISVFLFWLDEKELSCLPLSWPKAS